ncbi:hypothetical protein DUNSADRAFT_15536 [Dunaliella salina]|uniref:SWIM-type domain-containing protein n=1 Tax=Dunaliella salina TaxID=3046 RepID=A0ABQ7G595_DUNSA|nr:hypothetical protein DUNSADRAFT_15536 [Dunaliella salina]|eukprot:KAF5829772.1 hypothetical protein DUNSADRAFT_15536 [Dunaliella salina]
MSGRAVPWRTHPPQVRGPTSFIVREDGHETKRKVTIGSRPSCTCSSSGANGNKELCLHVLFTMLKILRVPATNPLVWQLSLTGECSP